MAEEEVIDSLVKKLVLLEEIGAVLVHENLEQLVSELLQFQHRRDAHQLATQKDSVTEQQITEAMEVATRTEGLMENFLNRAYQKRLGWTCVDRVTALNDLIDRRKIKKNLVRLKDKAQQVNIQPSSSFAQQGIIGMVNSAIGALEKPHPHCSEGGDGPAKSIVKELKRLLPLLEEMKEVKDSSNWVDVKSYVWLWEKETRMLAEEAIRTHFSHPQGISTREPGEEMERIKIRIQDIVRDIEQRLRQVGLQQGNTQLIIGLQAEKETLVDMLISSEVHWNWISIVGMAGIGKTTLAMLLCRDERVTKHFNACAWVNLSEQCDYNDDRARSDLRQNIESQLWEKQFNHGEEEESAAGSRSQRYLIVLDDVWSTTVCDSLEFVLKGIPILNGSTAKVLITTRSMHIAAKASAGRIYKMRVLNDEESWVLFNAFLKFPTEFDSVGRKIVAKCGGLPPAIIAMGRRLSGVTDPCEWMDVLHSMFESHKGGPKSRSESHKEGPWYHISESIKKNLPWHLRRCLIYFVLFSAKFEIPVRRLIALWVAEEGLIPRNDEQLPEELAESYLRELIDLDMVQVTQRNLTGKVKTCRLPEPVWEFWVSEARKYNFFRIPNISSKFSTEYLTRRLADHLDNKDDECHEHIHGKDTNSFSYQKVYFLSFDTRGGSQPGKEVQKFINRCISYRGFLLLLFLDLENVFRPQLPKALCKLTRLRYLGLRRTYLVKLPSFIDKLLNLQTLDLKHTYIGTLPGSIWKMRQLRHLYLSEAYRSRFVRPTYWPLCCVRYDIYLTQLPTLWGAFIDEKSPVIGGLDTLPNIRKLGLASRLMSRSQRPLMSSKLDAVADRIAKLKKLKSLRLKSYDENGEPSDLHLVPFTPESELSSIYLLGRLNNLGYRPDRVFKKLFPKSLTEITLSASLLTSDPMKMLGELEKLQILQLFHESYGGVEMRCSEGVSLCFKFSSYGIWTN